MTKEEIIKHLHEALNSVDITFPYRYVFVEAIEALSTLSLPANLDEAAEEVYPKMSRLSEPHGVIPADYKTHYLGDANEENRVAFKAGAEWMAGQGQTFEAHIDNGCAISSGVKLPFVLWNTYEDGDVLKVQIRKK